MKREIMGALDLIDRIALAGTGTSVARSRAQPIEMLRIVAAFGIVLFHIKSEQGSSIGYAGLIIFLFLLSYFEAKSKASGVATLAPKLLVPWLFWFGVFAITNFLKSGHVFNFDQALVTDILSGPSPHLWFLPYAFIMCAVIRLLKSRYSSQLLGLVFGSLSFAMITTEYWWDAWVFQHSIPAPEYVISLIPITAGVSAALTPHIGWPFAVLGALLGALETAHLDVAFGSIYCIGICAIAVAMILNRVKMANLINAQQIARYMFGVYLCHPLFITVMNATGMKPSLLKALAAFTLSLCFTWLLSGQPIRYFLQPRSQLVPRLRI